VHISQSAWELAMTICGEWEADGYDIEKITLFTGVEKAESIVRVAIAVANLCFSHPEGDIYAVDVRDVHVEWAAKWIEKCWANLEYGEHSEHQRKKDVVGKPLDATIELLRHFPTHMEGEGLQELMRGQDVSQFCSMFEFENFLDQTRFIARMNRFRVFTVESQGRGRPLKISPTPGGMVLLKRLFDWAIEDPVKYDEYAKAIRHYSGDKTSRGKPPDLTNDLEWDKACDGDTDWNEGDHPILGMP